MPHIRFDDTMNKLEQIGDSGVSEKLGELREKFERELLTLCDACGISPEFDE